MTKVSLHAVEIESAQLKHVLKVFMHAMESTELHSVAAPVSLCQWHVARVARVALESELVF